MCTPGMRAPGWLRAAPLPLVLLGGCGGADVVAPANTPAVRPLIFEYFSHPRWVQPGVETTVRAGVFVGPGSRWVAETAGVELRGDSLVLEGTATESTSPTTPPDRTLQYDTLTVAVPPLAAGSYWFVAGDLADLLEVSIIGPSGADTLLPDAHPFVAHGQFVLQSQSPCIWFEPRHPLFDEVAGWIVEGTVTTGNLHGTLIGTSFGSARCEGVSARAIRIREFIRGASMGDTQPVTVWSFVHPGVLRTNRPGELEADVYVGSNSCWELLEAGIAVRQDTLALSGTAMMVSNEPCTRISVLETITIPIPPLPAGTYWIRPENPLLADTLMVSSYAALSKPYVAAVGTLCPPRGDWRCGEPEFVPLYQGHQPLPADVIAPSPVDRCTFGTLAGLLVDRTDCGGDPRRVVRLRGWRPMIR